MEFHNTRSVLECASQLTAYTVSQNLKRQWCRGSLLLILRQGYYRNNTRYTLTRVDWIVNVFSSSKLDVVNDKVGTKKLQFLQSIKKGEIHGR